jgi:hypothetical protein
MSEIGHLQTVENFSKSRHSTTAVIRAECKHTAFMQACLWFRRALRTALPELVLDAPRGAIHKAFDRLLAERDGD